MVKFYLTDGARTITEVPKLTWLTKNAHRVVALKAFRLSDTNQGKLIACLKDGKQFHATFKNHRTILSWLFHPEFQGIPLGLFEFAEGAEILDWNDIQLDGNNWITAGSPEHWNFVSKFMGK